MKRSTVLLFYTFLVVLLVLAVVILVPTGTKKYVRSPLGPAVAESGYDEVMDPLFGDVSRLLEFGEMEVVMEDTGARLEFSRVSTGEVRQKNLRYEYHRIAQGGEFAGDGGTIVFDYYAIGYGVVPPEEIDDYSTLVPATYFDENFEEISPDEIADRFPRGGGQEISFNGRFPTVLFGFKSTLQEEMKVLGYKLLDPVLKRSLATGYTWGEADGRQYVEAELEMWYSGPVEVAMDVAFGPTETYELAAESGAVQKFGDGKVMVLAILPGMRTRSNSQSGDHFTVSFVPDEGRESITSVALALLPDTSGAPLDFEFMDSDGNKLSTGGSSSTGGIQTIKVSAEPGEIHAIRMIHYPHSKRLVFRFPALPGFPEENESIANLFETHIPFIHIRYDHEMTQILEKLLGLDITGTSIELNGTFPVTYEAITAGELFEKYLAMKDGRHHVNVDVASGRIEISPRARMNWIDRVKEWWRRLKP